ncbi:hypothetical protein V7201_10720 [Bacillus sp. JJ1122]|uniref:hypothetical protein n=1 Tax=Bacillus sp. JJ1122 TaxID=3122951 RepID=UPI002FFE4B6B
MREFNLNELSVKDIVKLMMVGTQYETFKDLSEKLDIPASTLAYSLNNNALRFRDLQKVAELLGYEFKLEKK